MKKCSKQKIFSIKLPRTFVLNNFFISVIRTEIETFKDRHFFFINDFSLYLVKTYCKLYLLELLGWEKERVG